MVCGGNKNLLQHGDHAAAELIKIALFSAIFYEQAVRARRVASSWCGRARPRTRATNTGFNLAKLNEKGMLWSQKGPIEKVPTRW